MLTPNTMASEASNLGHISLIGLKFLRSTLGKRQDVKGQDHIFLAAIVAEMHLLPVIVEQGKSGARSPAFKVVCDTFTFCCAPSGATKPTASAANTSAVPNLCEACDYPPRLVSFPEVCSIRCERLPCKFLVASGVL